MLARLQTESSIRQTSQMETFKTVHMKITYMIYCGGVKTLRTIPIMPLPLNIQRLKFFWITYFAVALRANFGARTLENSRVFSTGGPPFLGGPRITTESPERTWDTKTRN